MDAGLGGAKPEEPIMHPIVRFFTVIAITILLALSGAAVAAESSRPDPWITTKVKMSLLSSDRVDGLDVNVDTVDGRVTLHGTVDSADARAGAEELARGIEGVRDVRNLLQIGEDAEAQAAEVSDDELRQRIETVLQRDQALEDSDIEVQSVNDGVVVLAGEASTLSAHRRALEDVAAVEGVRHVASEIESPDELADAEIWAEGRMDDGEQDTSRAARDLWITTKTKVALMTDDQAPGLGLNVDTHDGVVTLFGTVATDAQRQAAAQRARQVEGVKRVENELQVVPEAEQERVAQSDERIREAIVQRLEERSDLEDASIEVAVSDGVARLAGTVKGRGDHLTALTVAGDAQGVQSVVDDLRVEPPAVSAGPSDAE